MNCPSCGSANPATAKFCNECGAVLAVAPAGRKARRVVTVVFADVVGSTALGEELDPEPLRRRMSATFAEMRAVLERHGGRVEKFIGDAVMAVFGIPTLHEDDPLRAVRAAAELRDRVAAPLRIGVNTGEVVVGDPSSGETLVTGDAVNTAARLEQAAEPGEILVGHETLRHVRDAVRAEETAPVMAKGKGEPVRAHRLHVVSQRAEGHARRLDAPMVGRRRELDRLRRVWTDVVADRRSGLFTLLGPAGVGKSRLVREFLQQVGEEATVLRGRALPYGEGITYRPLAESLHELARIADDDSREDALSKLRAALPAMPDGDQVAERLATAIGLSDETATADEIRWAVRRLFTTLAADRPLIVVWEDVQWAEPAFLDLVLELADRVRDAPILLLLPARPELHELRPAWGGGIPNSASVLLESLDREASGALLLALPGGRALPGTLRDRVLDAAEGNPLFVEELVGMLADERILRPHDGQWSVSGDLDEIPIPPTIHALLAARLDRLEPAERVVAERAAVIGRSFELAALAAISADIGPERVAASVTELARKELVQPDASLPADAGYRFRHLLIRDAAYASIAKEDRAALHERYADHLADAYPERADELAEIIAHHLRETSRYLREIGVDASAAAARAAGWLARGAELAWGRDDVAAAEKLARAALDMDSVEGARAGLVLGEVLLRTGRVSEADEVLAQALDGARRRGDGRLAAHLRIQLLHVAHHLRPDSWIGETQDAVPGIVEVLERFADDLGLARAWRVLGVAMQSDAAEASRLAARSVEHAERAGNRIELSISTCELANMASSGDTPVSTALALVHEFAGRPGLTRSAAADLQETTAVLEAMAGSPSAPERVTRAIEEFRELGLAVDVGFALVGASIVHLLRGELAEAERHAREGHRTMIDLGEQSLSGYLAVQVGAALVRQGRFEEAAAFVERVRAADSGDALGRAAWRGVQARIDASRGDFASARRLVDEGLAMLDPRQITRYSLLLMDKAWVLEAAGERAEAREVLTMARELLARKENVALLRQVDDWIRRLN